MRNPLPRPPDPDNKIAAVLPNFGVGDSFNHIGMVRYLATKYEKVYFFAWESHNPHAASWFEGEKNIEVLLCPRGEQKLAAWGGAGAWDVKNHEVAKNIINCDWHLTASHVLYEFPISPNFGKLHDSSRLIFGSVSQMEIPLSNYDAVGVPRSAFWDYALVRDTEVSENLFKKAVDVSEDYVFLHNSYGIYGGNNCMEESFINDFIQEDKNKVLFIDPNFNHYEPSHKWHNVASQFINVPNVLSYKKLMLNAKKILVLDSAFLCMGYQLEPKTDDCYYMCRPHFLGHSWDFVYESYMKDSSKKRKVKQFKKMDCDLYQKMPCPMCGAPMSKSRGPLSPEAVEKYNSEFNKHLQTDSDCCNTPN
tara:strand:- start:11967 stop:13055 length:1089 start_codon:yes stop_codon:yes gene_type:complete